MHHGNEQVQSHGLVQDCDISSVLVLEIQILQQASNMTDFTKIQGTKWR